VYALPDYFGVESVNYGQLVKIRDERGRLIWKERRIIYGDSMVEDIEIVNVENFNGVLWERLGRLVRRANCILKKKLCLYCVISFFLFYWNFILQIKRHRMPAMIEGLSSYVWIWHDFYTKLNHLN
jgi:hypothetical protein